MHEVALVSRSTDGFRGVVPDEDVARLDGALERLRVTLGPRRLWHVNSTDQGGGVAEMLSSLLPYAIGADVPVRWLVIDGDDRFFQVTKRLHNRMHDVPGDGGPLGADERASYRQTLATEGQALLGLVEAGDVVILHDPQTAGLAPVLAERGVWVAWRSHIGVDEPGELARSAHDFLVEDVLAARAFVFTRPAYVWDRLPADRVEIVAPCIDVLSPKNQPMEVDTCHAILHSSALVMDGQHPGGSATYEVDGERRLVRRRAVMLEDAPIPAGARLVTQVSRWDRLKDPVGLVQAFARHGPATDDIHLVVAGPSVEGVSDDPEGLAAFHEVRDTWRALAEPHRRRVHLASVPMDDQHENAAIINALQRRADVVVQKSRAEGFGLTVAEAMWKRRAVVASRVGGVQDQIVDGESGVLIDDPDDLEGFGRAIGDLLADIGRAARLGAAAHQRVCDRYLPTQHFTAEAALVARSR